MLRLSPICHPYNGLCRLFLNWACARFVEAQFRNFISSFAGILRDLNIDLAQDVASGQDAANRSTANRTDELRAQLVFSFILGSTLDAFLFYLLEYFGFWGPALISTAFAVLILRRPRFLIGVLNARVS